MKLLCCGYRLKGRSVHWNTRHNNLPDAILRGLAQASARCFPLERLMSRPTEFLMGDSTRSPQRRWPAFAFATHAYAYCSLLAFGLFSTLGWGTPPFCTLVAYTFFGLDALGGELKESFGRSLNALSLDAMTRHVEISILEARVHNPATISLGADRRSSSLN